MKTRYIIVSSVSILLILSTSIYLLHKPEKAVHKESQSNEDHNLSLIKNNVGFLGVCIRLAINDIEQQGANPNDFRIISYKYDKELVTIPHDTTDRFYSFKVFYTKQDSLRLAMRVASYHINFKEQIQRMYDVLAVDENDKEQLNGRQKKTNNIDSLKK